VEVRVRLPGSSRSGSRGFLKPFVRRFSRRFLQPHLVR
jgi:hypothetical protein